MVQKISSLEKKIKKDNQGLSYSSPSSIKIDKSFPKAQTGNEALKTQINKDIQRLQGANADGKLLETNLKNLEPNQNTFFQILDYMSRIPRALSSLVGGAFASDEQREDLAGVGETYNPFAVSAEVLTTGKAPGQGLGEEFTGANMLQTIFSNETISTEDWADISKILGSIAVEFPLDPLTYLIGPLMRTVGKGVKAGAKGSFNALKTSSQTGKKIAETLEQTVKGTRNLEKAKKTVYANLKQQGINIKAVNQTQLDELIKKELKGKGFGANKLSAVKNAFGVGKLRNVSRQQAISESNIANIQKIKSMRERKIYKSLQENFEGALSGRNPEAFKEFKSQGIFPKGLKEGSGYIDKKTIKEAYKKYFPLLESKISKDMQMMGRPYYQEGLFSMINQIRANNSITPDNADAIKALLTPDNQGVLAAVNKDAVKYPMTIAQTNVFVDDLRNLGLLPLKGDVSDYLIIRELGGTTFTNPATNKLEKLSKEYGGVEFYFTEKFNKNLKQVEAAFFSDANKTKNVRNLMDKFETLEKFAYETNLKSTTTELLRTYKQFNTALNSMLSRKTKVKDFGKFRELFNKIRSLDPELGKEMGNQIAKLRRLDARYKEITSVALRNAKFGKRAKELTTSVRGTLNKVGQRIDDEYAELRTLFRKRFDKVVDMGEEYVSKNNPIIKKAAQELQNTSNLRFKFAKTVGAGDDIIDEFVYILDTLDKPMRGVDGNPITKQYLAKAVKDPDEVVKISRNAKNLSSVNESTPKTFIDKATRANEQAKEGMYRGSAQEWNEIRRMNQAKKFYNANKSVGNITEAKRWEDALKMADNYDLFYESPFASSVKGFQTITNTWGSIGTIRQAFKDNFIVSYKQIASDPKYKDEFLMNNFIELNHSEAGNMIARMDPKLAIKVSRNEKITSEEIGRVLKNETLKDKSTIFEGYKYDPDDKLYVNKHLNQLLTTWAPSADETKAFVKGLDMVVGSWKKLALMSPGYMLRVMTGDLIHGMMGGVPLGSMMKGWQSGTKELSEFKKLDSEILKIADNGFSATDELFEGVKVVDIFMSNDIKKIEKYIDSKLSPKQLEIQELKRKYDAEGIINAGQWSQDSTFSKMNSSKDYDIFFKREMANRVKKIKNPTSINSLKKVLSFANKSANTYMSAGHYSAMASRIAVYKYMKKTKTPWRMAEKIGNPALKGVPAKEIRNFERLGFKSLTDATNNALYGNRLLSGFEKKYLTRLFPFYRFWRFALEQNIKNALKGNIGPYYHIQKFMNSVKDGQDIDNKDIPDYALQNNYLPIRLNDEKITLIKYGYTPSTLLNIVDNPGSSALSEVLGQISPLIKALVETATKTSTYTGMAYENSWDAFLSNMVPPYNTYTKKKRKVKKYDDNPSRERTPIIDDLDSIFTTLYTEDVEKSRLYNTRNELTEMMKKIRKEGGFIPNISDLTYFYNASILKKKDYY